MNPQYILIFAVAGMILVMFVFFAIFLSRYVKVGPNQVLIVSGRKIRLPDGTQVGFRIVKGGGTFVFPVVEKANVLSLEVLTIEMPKSKLRTAKGEPVDADCLAQVKINGDDASILAACSHFLSKKEEEIKSIVRPVLEKHLRTIVGNLSPEEVCQNSGECAARVQAAASVDLDKMGLGVISFTIQNVHAG